jgi:tRNA threonylcarbamoyl adenosine modification protein YeaZ
LILSICTISNNTSVCISNDSYCILSEIKSKNPNHCEELIPAIEDLLSKEDKVLEDVHQVRVNVGPGNLTSIRIGLTVANLYGQFLGAEIIGVSSFHCIASICKESNKDIIVAFNIRNNNYAYAIFDKKNQMLIDYRLVVNRKEFDQINKKEFKLLTDSSADSYLIDSSFDVVEINAEMISRLNISDIKDFIQKEVPLKPINDYSYVVNK